MQPILRLCCLGREEIPSFGNRIGEVEVKRFKPGLGTAFQYILDFDTDVYRHLTEAEKILAQIEMAVGTRLFPEETE